MHKLILILLIIMIVIQIIYRKEYKKNKDDIHFGVKHLLITIFKITLVFLFCLVLNFLFEKYIPLNKNHEFEFNLERNKYGVPLLNKNWTKSKYQSDQFTSCWIKEKNNGHFKKVIKYGIIGIKSEIDYYKKGENNLVWSKYNFDDKTFEYFIEIYNPKGKQNNLNFIEKKIIQKITKPEFENHINK